jgi:general secretion pathway protein A
MYERHFGLTAKPFQLSPDADFFFGSRGHRRALAYLEYGVHKGEGFIVVTGEVGAGKTTLLQDLIRRLPGDAIIAAQVVSTQLDADDLLRMVASAFGLESASSEKSALLVQLQAHLTSLHASGKRALLIVDEAQNLSPRAVEELRMLSNFQVGNQSLMQSFLVGQPEFRSVMQRPEMQQLKQRIIASYHLGPLDRPETERYIEHRLVHVGWKRDPSFTEAAFDRIHAASDGIPRRINALCDRLLLAAYLGDRHDIGPEDVEQVSAELISELGFGAVQPAAPALADLPRGAAPAEAIAALDQRITSLEASNSLIFDVLKRVLRALRGPTRKDTESQSS